MRRSLSGLRGAARAGRPTASGRGAAALSALLALAACGAPGCAHDDAAPHRTADLAPCFVEGLRAPALCGKVRVFEDRARGAGRTIDLQVVVVPALAASPAPDPVFFLAGGPGQAATQIAGFSLAAAERLHERRDLVFVDQRGTGGSHPLFCEAEPDDAPLAERFESGLDEEATRRCRDDQDADLRLYTTSLAVDDLDAAREALGYAKINLWGTSYGTRVGLAYLRAHGDHARSAVLDSVAPMSLYLPLSLARDAERALSLTFDDCAAEPACNKAFPDLRARFSAFVQRLDEEPVRAVVSHRVTGAREEVVIGRAAFLSGLRSFLYAPEFAALVPLVIDRAILGDFGAFVAMARSMSGGFERSVAQGMFLSVVCSEDVPFFRTEDLEREAEGTIFGPGMAREIARACDGWPRGDVPRSFRAPVESDVPVLLLSGALDPVTPPSWAEDAKKTLHHAASVVFTGTGHTAATSSCARRIAADFVERGSEAGLDTACAAQIRRPRFFTSFAGAP
jgi:pimeloyl-ACP methyl ester carboxylesterase